MYVVMIERKKNYKKKKKQKKKKKIGLDKSNKFHQSKI